ncbi:hypothetical protein IQ255_22415 [Pleurocapsales cyanobacterium LEGE 10410]|nr:hypothetical protein [Pleurocapsales cyanobacterium LEGE 10410]
MNNLSRYPNYKSGKCYTEIINTEIDRYREHKLPRHISPQEIKSHRGEQYPSWNKNSSSLPTFNQLKDDMSKRAMMSTSHSLRRAKATNLALDILKYQLSDRQSRQKHLENTHRNLERRLQVAKARGNDWLVQILQEEFKQLETSS